MKDRLIENEIRSVETDFNREKKFVLKFRKVEVIEVWSNYKHASETLRKPYLYQ